MPIEKRVEKDKRRVYAILTGIVSFDEMIHTINSSVEDPCFMPGFDVLSDHTKIEEPIKTEQVKALASHIDGLKNYFSGSRWAVVTSKEVSYGMMRMLAAYLERVPMELQVFYSFDDAEKWLSAPGK